MSCYYPRLAVNLGKKPENGKNNIKFIPIRTEDNINKLRSKWGNDLLLIPCGQCLGCKFDIAKDWATRAYCESLYHKENSFVTLTYDNKHLPNDYTVHAKDLETFWRALRKKYQVRYLASAELGETTLRPHYHAIIFGYIPKDIKLFSRNERGEPLFTSEELTKIWGKGQTLVGYFSHTTASYVARYTTKKIKDDGSFLRASNKPGIGYQYLIDHEKNILENECIYGNFGTVNKMPIPRYFEKYLETKYPKEWTEIVVRRLKHASIVDNNGLINAKFSHLEQLKDKQSRILEGKLNTFRRNKI